MKLLNKVVIGLGVLVSLMLLCTITHAEEPETIEVRVNTVTKWVHRLSYDGKEYYKLRDVARATAGTPRQFNVTYWSDSKVVNVANCENYVDVPDSYTGIDIVSAYTSTIYKDWNTVSIDAVWCGDAGYFTADSLYNLTGLIFVYDPTDWVLNIVSSNAINYKGSGKMTQYYPPDGSANYDYSMEGGAYDMRGKLLVPGVSCAADKGNFKYGQYIYIEGIGVRKVVDCGGMISGYHIDLCVTGANYRRSLKSGWDNPKCKVYLLSDI